MIATKAHTLEQILEDLGSLSAKKIGIIGCAECATTAGTGGIQQVSERLQELQNAGLEVTFSFVSEQACDPAKITAELGAHNAPSTSSTTSTSATTPTTPDAILTLCCGAGTQTIADALEDTPVIPGLDSVYYGSTVEPGSLPYDRCRMCGACTLGQSGGICAFSLCPKELMNGPCGGMDNGKCEIFSERGCVHALIRQRLLGQGRPLPGIIAPKDYNTKTGPGSFDGRRVDR